MHSRLFFFFLILISLPAHAESKKSISTGFDYSSGTYGNTTTTEVLYVPVTGKLQYDDGYLKLTVPYISVTGTESVVRGTGRTRTATTSTTTTTTRTRAITQSGLGDVVASAGYTVLDTDLLLDIVGNIKFATADASKNLGSGKNDYSAQLDGFYMLTKTTLLATAGYKIVGAPDGLNVNNIAYGSLGLNQKIDSKISAGAILDAAQASNEFSSGARELTFFVSNKLSNTLKVQAHLTKGFSDSSPDFGGGMMLTGSI